MKNTGLAWSMRGILCISDTTESKPGIEEFTIIIEDTACDAGPCVFTNRLLPGRDQLLAQWLMFEQMTDGSGQSLAIAGRDQ